MFLCLYIKGTKGEDKEGLKTAKRKGKRFPSFPLSKTFGHISMHPEATGI
jgi:hypothetical protein